MGCIINAQSIPGHRFQRGSTLLGIMVGLIIGVVIAVAVALYINFAPKPFVDRGLSNNSNQSSPIANLQSGPVALPGKPGDAPVEKPKLDFYDILPNDDKDKKNATNNTAASAPIAASAPVQPTETERYYLQLGAFRDPAEADNLKARLALIGMESSVQRIETPDKGVLLRVRLGPYSNIQEADNNRAQLIQNGIESSLIRSKTRAANATSGTASTSQ